MKAIAAIIAVASVTQGAATINVVVAASGAVTVDGHPVKDDNELADRARDVVRKSPDVRAVIAADKSVQYGRVVAVMDALKRAGVAKIAFAVGPPP